MSSVTIISSRTARAIAMLACYACTYICGPWYGNACGNKVFEWELYAYVILYTFMYVLPYIYMCFVYNGTHQIYKLDGQRPECNGCCRIGCTRQASSAMLPLINSVDLIVTVCEHEQLDVHNPVPRACA